MVTNPEMTGVFTHEAFGHLSEADFVYENPQMMELMILGKRFGADGLNIKTNYRRPTMRPKLVDLDTIDKLPPSQWPDYSDLIADLKATRVDNARLRAALRAIADMVIDESTDHQQMTALIIAIAKESLNE